MRNPCAYVVDDDLAAIPPGLVQRHLGELQQWRLADELSPTALAIVAVLSLYRGLRDGESGCGVQAPLEAWAAVLGRSRRMVAYAFAELEQRGYVRRFRRLVKVRWVRRWVDRWGNAREKEQLRADIHGAAYLTTYGYRRISRRGETRQLVVRNGHAHRVLVAAGVVGNLLKALAQNLRVVAKRVADVVRHCTPSFGEDASKSYNQKKRGSPVGNALSPRHSSPTQAPRRPGWTSPVAGTRGDRPRLKRLFAQQRLTARNAWPAAWSAAPDDKARLWLESCASVLVVEFSREELQLEARERFQPSMKMGQPSESTSRRQSPPGV